MAYQSYSIPSSATLGCRFMQDEEKGKDAGICTAAVEPGGSADRAGIVVGMLVYGIHGDPVAGMEFNDVMQLVRKARSAHDAWTIELIHPINQPAEHSIRCATLLDEKGLNEFANVKGSDEGGGGLTGGLRRLSVAVGIKTHEEEPPKPVPLKLAGIGEGGERRASIASQGSDGGTPSSGRRASITAGSEGMGPTGPSGRRASIASQGSDGTPVAPGSGAGLPYLWQPHQGQSDAEHPSVRAVECHHPGAEPPYLRPRTCRLWPTHIRQSFRCLTRGPSRSGSTGYWPNAQ